MISRALKATREFHRMKQVELARLLEISPSFLSEVESGQKTPSLTLLEKYGQVFNIPPSTFLLFVEKANASSSSFSAKNAERLLQFLEWVMEEDPDEDETIRHGGDDERAKTLSA